MNIQQKTLLELLDMRKRCLEAEERKQNYFIPLLADIESQIAAKKHNLHYLLELNNMKETVKKIINTPASEFIKYIPIVTWQDALADESLLDNYIAYYTYKNTYNYVPEDILSEHELKQKYATAKKKMLKLGLSPHDIPEPDSAYLYF